MSDIDEVTLRNKIINYMTNIQDFHQVCKFGNYMHTLYDLNDSNDTISKLQSSIIAYYENTNKQHKDSALKRINNYITDSQINLTIQLLKYFENSN